MNLYIFISIAVVLLSTATLLLIFHRNHTVDLRYRIGLVLSAIFACTGSLLFPGLLNLFSQNMALRFFIVFFLSLLLYIVVLFIMMILVFQIVSIEKMDDLVRKWEEKKQKRKDARELKLKEKEEKAAISNNALKLNPEQNTDSAADEGSAPNGPDMAGAIEKAAETLNVNSNQEQVADSAVDLMSDDEKSASNGMDTVEGIEKAVETPNVNSNQEQVADSAVDLMSDDEKSASNGQYIVEAIEKTVDTPDIIDKMGIDELPDSVQPAPEQENSLEEIIHKAFSLKQQGNVLEAAALYMEALDQKPDNETAFWIVLDICAIYKSTGNADLAEDILLTYIDAFEHLMSEEIKDQILQSLFDS